VALIKKSTVKERLIATSSEPVAVASTECVACGIDNKIHHRHPRALANRAVLALAEAKRTSAMVASSSALGSNSGAGLE
jgi:hypothetical protein